MKKVSLFELSSYSQFYRLNIFEKIWKVHGRRYIDKLVPLA